LAGRLQEGLEFALRRKEFRERKSLITPAAISWQTESSGEDGEAREGEGDEEMKKRRGGGSDDESEEARGV
jgi:hypothetical protein